MATAKRRGFEKLLYYGVAGSTAATQVINATDVDHKVGTEKADVTVRGSSGVPQKGQRVTQLAPEVSWKMMVDTTDSTLLALLSAADQGTPVALKVMNASGQQTLLDGDFILEHDYSGPLAGAQEVSFTALNCTDTRNTTLYT